MRKLTEKPAQAQAENKMSDASLPVPEDTREGLRITSSLHAEIKDLDIAREVLNVLKASSIKYPHETHRVVQELLAHHEPTKLFAALTFLKESDPHAACEAALRRLPEIALTERISAFLSNFARDIVAEELKTLSKSATEPLKSIATRTLTIL